MRMRNVCSVLCPHYCTAHGTAHSIGWALGLMLLLLTAHTPAAQVTLAWNAPTTYTNGTPLTDLAGYNLYYGQVSIGITQKIHVGNKTTYTFTDLVGGETYSFAVTAYDASGYESSNSNIVTVTVAASNHAPLALADTAFTPAATPVAIAVLDNDTDPDDDPLTITAVTQPAYGAVTLSGTTVTYAPAPTFAGTDSFIYTITDSHGASATAPVTVTVTALENHAPVARADTVATLVGTPIVIAVLANDMDSDGNPLTITAVTQGAHGAVTISGITVTYAPAPTFAGTDSFSYTITDSHGTSATATVNVTVFVMVQLEAEAGKVSSPMTVGTTTTVPPLQYVWVPENNADILDPLQNGGFVQYDFTVPKADGYVVWGRVSPDTTGMGSFFIGIDEPVGNGLITNVSPTAYQVATLHVGSTYYVDNPRTITAMPATLDGLGAIKTAHADQNNNTATFLTFTLLQAATLYVAYDATVSAIPRWLTTSFTQTGERIQVTNGQLEVWKKEVPAGPITLPGNQYQAPQSLNAQYFVLLAFHGPAPYLVWNISPTQGASPSPQPWVWDQAAGNTTPIFFLEAGNHTLTIRQRESGTKLDKLVITNNVLLIPQP